MPGLSWTQRRPIWLLEVDVGGHVYRYATTRISVTSAAGPTYVYEAGLEPLELGSTRTLGRRSVPVTIHAMTDWPQVEGRGIPLDQRRAVIRLHYAGDTLEAGQVYVDGLTEDVRYRHPGEPLTLSVVEDIASRALPLPSPQAAATDETWPVRGGYELTSGANGKIYPVVIGYPGDHPKAGGTDLAEPAIPALWVERDSATSTNDRWIFALGRIDAAQATLYYYDADDWQQTDLSVSSTVDALGQTVAYVQTSSLANSDAEWWVGLRNASGWGAGLLSPYTGGVLRGAGEVTRYLLDYFTDARVDVSRLAGGSGWLDRFQVDGVLGIGERERVTDWLERLMEHLPVIGVDGPRGLYFAPLRWDATALDAVAHLDADRSMMALDGEIAQWDEDVYNSFTVRYRPKRGGAEWASTRTLTSIQGNLYEAMTAGANLPPFSTSLPWMATTEQDDRIIGSSLCRMSQARYGMREMPVVELGACWDDYTAALVLHYLAARHALPKRQARYVGGDVLSSLYPGDIVTVTDTPSRLSAAVAMVLERTISLSGVALDLVLLDHPRHTQRLTS